MVDQKTVVFYITLGVFHCVPVALKYYKTIK